MHLPTHISPTEFDTRYRLDAQGWILAIEELCMQHGLSPSDITPFTDGSNLIASVADCFVVKIFPPFHQNQWESERRTLARLWGNGLPTSVPIPRLIAEGKREDGWTYVILSRLPGVTLESVWPRLVHDERVEIMSQIGRIMAEVHAVPVGELQDLDPPWVPFLRAQVKSCKARHERLGMPAWFVGEIEAYVASNLVLDPNESPVILTGEYTPFNLLVGQMDSQWRITGMIDFGDAMIGYREYDFLGPCLFLGEGNASLIDSLFHAYGYASPRGDSALRKRLMSLAILHRYSNLNAQIRIDSWSTRVESVSALERLVFGC